MKQAGKSAVMIHDGSKTYDRFINAPTRNAIDT